MNKAELAVSKLKGDVDSSPHTGAKTAIFDSEKTPSQKSAENTVTASQRHPNGSKSDDSKLQGRAERRRRLIKYGLFAGQMLRESEKRLGTQAVKRSRENH
jgi:hypothetical protein